MSKTSHISRLAAPKTWPIERKGIKWITKSNPGAHNLNYSMPLVIYLRDILKITNTAKEAKKALTDGLILINNSVVRKIDYAVGLFDVIKIPKISKVWRIFLTKKGRLNVIETSEDESKILPLKIVSKNTLDKGKIQLNFSNGWNLINDGKYNIGDTLLFDLEKKSIIKSISLKEGNMAYMTSGRHTGYIAKLKEIKETGTLKKFKIATMEASDGEIWQSPVSQIFMIGENKPEIKLEK